MRTGRLHIAIHARKVCYTCTQGFECCHTTHWMHMRIAVRKVRRCCCRYSSVSLYVRLQCCEP